MEVSYFNLEGDFLLESGAVWKDIRLAYHSFGTMKPDQSNVVWVFHAFTANSDVTNWWGGLFGGGKFFNPDEHFVICVNILGSPYGSSRQSSADQPFFSVRDIVKSQLALAEHLGVQRINRLIGGSLGGAQAMEFAYSFTGQIDSMVLISCAVAETPWGVAIHEAQRLALTTDPTFGQPNGGQNGLKAARAMGMVIYRTFAIYKERQTDAEEKLDHFRAASYIQYQGDKIVNRFDALAYYFLSKTLDSHDLGRGRGGAEKVLSSIQIPTLVIGVQEDLLIPVHEQIYLAEKLPQGRFAELQSIYGHDSFLVEDEAIERLMREFFETLG